MTQSTSSTQVSTAKLILIPSVVTLAITILRLVGELQHWSSRWFSATPYGTGSLVGITWLAPVFGIYFALKISRAGQRPKSLMRAIGLAVVAVGILLVTVMMGFKLAQKNFLALLIVWWAFAVIVAALQYAGWPALFKSLFVYALAARVPVTAIMFFAMRGQWGTHYDWILPLFPYTGFWARWVCLALIPQLTFWVGFTIVAGMLFGTLITAVLGPRRQTLAKNPG